MLNPPHSVSGTTASSQKQEDKISVAKSVTPMMAQYLTIKRQNPNTLLFYRMGDFYELFFEDAISAAKTLDITLTKRGKHDNKDIPMCGVPAHSHESYLLRLIKAGFKVAICEQTEDPAEARRRGPKAIVTRSVVRIITPGTLTEDTLLDTRSNNYLASLAHAQGKLGLAWFDISTSEFLLQEETEVSLPSALARLEPREILISEDLVKKVGLSEIFKPWKEKLTLLPLSRFDSTNGDKRLQNLFKVKTMDVFGSFSRGELAAGGALIDYIELTQVGQVPRIAPPRRFEPSQTLEIDHATRRNLELAVCLNGERKGSLLSVIDRTQTAAGARALAARLSAPLTDLLEINSRLDAIQLFIEKRKLRETVRVYLKSCPDLDRALSRITLNRGSPRDLASIRDGLHCANKIQGEINLNEIPEGINLAPKNLGSQSALINLLDTALSPDLPFNARDGGLIASGYSSDLENLRDLRDKSRKLILSLEEKYSRETLVPNLKIKHNNVLGYFIEVTTRHSEQLTAAADSPYIHRQTMKNAMRFATVELGELEGRISSSSEKTLALELQLFDGLVQEVLSQSENISLTAIALASLDVAAALGDLAVSEHYCRPKVDDGSDFNIVGGRHPVVERALSLDAENNHTTGFISNDCTLSSDKRLWLLTGPNMAGKSTFLRQNALITILAQMGSFVPAESAHLGRVDRLFSRVGAADDLARGRSTFMVEMVETAAILSQATERSFVILDEIGRGTATFDGLSIAWAVVEYLHDINKCRGLFATHYHELTNLTSKLRGLACNTMRVKEWRGDVVFLHEVTPGSADRSYGIHVGKLAGLPPEVINRAQNVLSTFEKENRTGSVKGLANTLPLFATDNVQPGARELSRIEKKLDQVSPDDLSPRDALELIYTLKNFDH